MTAQEIQKAAAALGGLAEQGAEWSALRAVFEADIAEANDKATAPETDETKRQGWCFYERALREVWRELNELRSGEYRNWPLLAQALEQEQLERMEKEFKKSSDE